MDLLHIGLGCVQLSLSCPFRLLHTFHFLRPARLRTPLLGYGAPHLSAKGTSTLLNNALLSAHFRLAANPRVAGIPTTRCVYGFRNRIYRPRATTSVRSSLISPALNSRAAVRIASRIRGTGRER